MPHEFIIFVSSTITNTCERFDDMLCSTHNDDNDERKVTSYGIRDFISLKIPLISVFERLYPRNTVLFDLCFLLRWWNVFIMIKRTWDMKSVVNINYFSLGIENWDEFKGYWMFCSKTTHYNTFFQTDLTHSSTI